MDAKITKNRLSRLLAYDWVKILALIVAFIVGWMVLFTSTESKIRPSQRFTVISYYCNDTLSDDFENLLSDSKNKDKIFSYETLEGPFRLDLTKTGLNDIVSVLESRFATSEGDLMFVPYIPYAEEDDLAYERTYADNFFNRFSDNVYKLDTEADRNGPSNLFFVKYEAYINGFYYGDYKAGNLDEYAVEQNFRRHVKETGDKRFRKESLIKEALPLEKERIKKYRDALVEFNGYLQSGVIEIVEMNRKDDKGNILWTGDSAINLCPDESKMGNLKKYLSYTVQEEYEGVDEQTGEPITLTRSVKTAKDMYAMILYHEKVEPGYEYESILYLNYLIKHSLTA